MKQSANTDCPTLFNAYTLSNQYSFFTYFKKAWYVLAFVFCALSFSSELYAQSCENSVPYLVIDLSASPSTSSLVFLGGDDVVDPCCSSQPHQLNCQEVLILMHENAVGIQFTQPTPPVQCAIDVFDLSNGCPISAPTSICDPICAQPVYNPQTGNYELRLSFCKPGNFNETDINFESIANVEPVTISQGQSCETTLMVSGAATTYDWTCTSPISNLNYLNCGSGPGVGITCQNPVFHYTGPQVTDCNGQVVTYCVQQAGTCSFTQATINVTLYPDPASYNAHVDVDCSGEAPVLIAVVDGFPCPDDLAYQWFDSNGNPLQGAESVKFFPGLDDGMTYTVEISSVKATGCPPAVASGVASCCSPQIVCPSSTTIECGDGAALQEWLVTYEVESCGDPYSVSPSYELPDCNGTTGSTTVVFTLIISEEPVGSCSTSITISDTTAPQVPADGSATVACASQATMPIPPSVMDVCGGQISPTGPTVSNEPNPVSCEGTRTYTWTYTDCSNNSSTWSYVYTIEYNDFTMPANAASTVACPSATNTVPVPPTVQDNCGNAITPVGPEVSAIPNCEGNRTYTWTYTDCEGNSHPWVYTYTVEYQDFSVPANGSSTVACPSATNTVPVPPTVQDNCGNTITPSGPVASAMPSCEGTRTYTWMYMDCEGNLHPWVYTYTVEYQDFLVPTGGSSTVACPSATNAVPTPPTVQDNCGNTIVPSGPVASAIPSCEGNRTYTWTYTDCEGNSHPWVYTYTVEYNDFVMPANGASTVACPSATNATPTPPVVQDNCGNTIVPSGPVASAVPSCEGTRTYTWTYTDCEGNSHPWVHTYTVEYNDFVMPANGASTVACPSATNATPTPPVVQDNCGNTIVPSGPVASAVPSCEGTRTYTWTYTDCEGNSHPWVHTYTVEYNDFVMPANGASTVACPSATNTAPTPPVVQDNCGNTIVPSGPVASAMPACEGDRTYTWIYTDCEGNSHPWVYTYTVDRAEFSIATPNGVATVDCPAKSDVVPLAPLVLNSCGQMMTPVLLGSTPKPGCGGDRLYTFRYTDCSGNTADWYFTYHVVYQNFTMPSNESLNIECPSNATMPVPPTVFDRCGNLLTPIGPVVSSLSNDGGCEGSRSFEWTYSDCSGNKQKWSRTYNFLYSGEFFTYPDVTSAVGCVSHAQQPLPPTVYDNCGQEVVAELTSTTEEISAGACAGWRKFTYTYTDCLGRTRTWSFTYLIEDKEGPLGTCPSGPVGGVSNISVGINNLTCIEEVPCPTDYDFSSKVEEMLEEGNYYDVCSGSDLVVTLDSWTELWRCEDVDGDGVPTFGRTFYFHIADPCGNEYPSLCAVTYQGHCQPIETFTQEQWGTQGDEPGNSVTPPTTDLSVIETLLAQGGPLTVGGANRSLSFTAAQCVVDMLPSLGGPTVLGNCHQTNCVGCNPAGPAGMKNALAANATALDLNLRYNVQYNGLTLAQVRSQSLGCVDVHECITLCETGEDCHLKMYDQDNLLHDFPYTLGGLLDMANMYLDGGLHFTQGQEVLYSTTLNKTIMNVNSYWNKAAASTCDPSADASPLNDESNKVVINQKNKSDKAGELSLVPNPANSFVTVKLDEMETAQDIELTVFNALGQQVRYQKFEQASSINERLNTADMEGGIYFVVIKAGAQRFDKKLIIAKQ